MIQIPFLNDDPGWFPPVELALDDPDGLLAGGGDLSLQRLLNAYRHGIFPWYQDDQPILWWSPSTRAILQPTNLRISRSLRKNMRNKPCLITADTAFEQVISACAAPRAYSRGTWITAEMRAAYCQLHAAGHAHSIEVWRDDRLIGGLYGIAIGACYFGESMFSVETDASKMAFAALIHFLQSREFRLIDCQMMTPHLESLGATPLPRRHYMSLLHKSLRATASDSTYLPGSWPLKIDSITLESVLKQMQTAGFPDRPH